MIRKSTVVNLAVSFLLGVAAAAGQQQAAPAKPEAAKDEGGWRPLWDGKTLEGWKESEFLGRGKVTIQNGTLTLGKGYMTGIAITKPFPTMNYEIRLEAARLDGMDFFAAITFPVNDAECTWINGGWGGSMVGLSSLDYMDASENETSTGMRFEQKRWYKFRLRVVPGLIQGWIDDELFIDVNTTGKHIGLREGTDMEQSAPLGFASYSTVAGLRNIEWREVKPEAQ